MDLSEHWNDVAIVRAPAALNMARWDQGGDIARFSGIQQQFPFISEPTPLQQFSIDQPLKQGAQLFILEDITGAGKTEAAMVLAHRLIISITRFLKKEC